MDQIDREYRKTGYLADKEEVSIFEAQRDQNAIDAYEYKEWEREYDRVHQFDGAWY